MPLIDLTPNRVLMIGDTMVRLPVGKSAATLEVVEGPQAKIKLGNQQKKRLTFQERRR